MSAQIRREHPALEPLDSKTIKSALGASSSRDLALPDLEPVDWGVLDYFGWVHPSGHTGYVVMAVQQGLVGLKLRRMANQGGRPKTHMCSWCNHAYRGRGTAMFSAAVRGSDGRRRIGNFICQNLDCSLRMRNLASDPPTFMPETIPLTLKIYRLQQNMHAFAIRANQFSDFYGV